MPVNVLKLIPTLPQYVPNASTRQQARNLLASYVPEAISVKETITNDVRFIDQGSNFERVKCPIDGTELDLGWWQQAMDAAYQTRFTNLAVILPCCGTVSSLNDLHYESPAGFARFVLEVDGPNTDLSDKQIHLLEEILECELRKIWAHY